MALNDSVTKSTVKLDGADVEAELIKLTELAKKYKQELKTAKLNNDMDAFAKAKKALSDVNKQTDELKKNTTSLDKVMSNLAGSSRRDLEKAYNSLRGEMRKMNRTTEEEIKLYKEKEAQLKQVRAEMKRMDDSMSSVSKKEGAFSVFGKYFAVAGTVIAGFTGAIMTLKSSVEAFNIFETRAANLSSLTGLQGKALDDLKKQARELSTGMTEDGVRITQSASDILDAYTLMGSAKPELLGDAAALASVTEDAIKLSAASGDALQPSVEALANTMNQFNATASESGRYINVLAAGSKEGAVAIPDINAAMVKFGAASAEANVSVEESVALIEALGEKGMKGEIAGTNLKNILLKLMSGADETNPKILGMAKALDNLAAKNMDAAEMVKVFGEENYLAAQILITNRDRYNELTEAVTGTNVAIEQALINTDTNAAKMAQAENKANNYAITLGEMLAPALLMVTNAKADFFKALIPIVDAFNLLTGNGKKASEMFNEQLQAVAGLKVNILPLANEYDTLSAKTNKSAEDHARMNELIKQITDVVPGAITKFDEYGNAVAISTGRVRDFIDAESARLKVINKDAIKESVKEIEKLSDKITEVKKNIDQVAAKGTYTIGYNVIGASGRPIRLTRNANQEEIAAEQAKYKELLEMKKGYEQQVKTLNGELLKEEQDRLTKEAEAKKAESEAKSKANIDEANKTVSSKSSEKDAYEKLNEKIAEQTKLLNAQIALDSPLAAKTAAQLERLKAQKQAIDDVATSMLSVITPTDNTQELQDQLFKDGEKSVEDLLANLGSEKKVAAMQTSWEMQKAELMNQYADKKITDEQLQYELEALELAHLGRIRQARLDAGESTLQIDRQIADKRAAITKAANEKEKRELDQKVQYYQAMSDALEGVVSQLISGQIKSFDDFTKTLLIAMLDMLDKIVTIKLAEMAATSLASADSVMSWGAAGLLRIAVLGGLIKGAIAGAKALLSSSMTTKQRASGRYDVIGADDGMHYAAGWGGQASTGIVRGPTLVSERGDELIVDGTTTRNIQLNAPWIIDSILSMRVPQRAEGNLPDPASVDYSAMLRLIDVLERGIYAKMVYTESEKVSDTVAQIRAESKTR